MDAALYETPVNIEKLVWQPVQVNTSMRTTVLVCINPVPVTDQKDILRLPGISPNGNSPALPIGQLVLPAKAGPVIR
jgi:hypothetical protein